MADSQILQALQTAQDAQGLSTAGIVSAILVGLYQTAVTIIGNKKINDAANSAPPDIIRRVDRLEVVTEEDRIEHGKLVDKINTLDANLRREISALDVKQSTSQAQLSAQLGGLETSVGRIDGTLGTILNLMLHKGENKP